MKKLLRLLLSACLCLGTTATVHAQSSDLNSFIPNINEITADEALMRAQEASSLTYNGSPFHAEMTISQPSEPKSVFQGTIKIDWADATKYRTEITSKDFQQIRIVNGEKIEERNTGDFYPAWLRDYLKALMNPLPRAERFQSNNRTPIVMLGKNISSSCINRDDRPNGITDQMTWGSICFQGELPLIHSVQDFTYFMEFKDYKPFGKKTIARKYVNYDTDNTEIVGQLTTLEPLVSTDDTLFAVDHPTQPEQRIETDFVSMSTNSSLLEKVPTIEWPKIREGKTEGNMIVHVITDRNGQVREAYRHNSDTPGLEDFGRSQALIYKFKPLLVNGAPRQMETPLVLHFKTSQGESLPVLTGSDIEKYAPGCNYKPILPTGLLPSGTRFKIRISVNEKGEDTGISFPPGISHDVIEKTGFEEQSCKFKQYFVNGQPWYHHIDFWFTAT